MGATEYPLQSLSYSLLDKSIYFLSFISFLLVPSILLLFPSAPLLLNLCLQMVIGRCCWKLPYFCENVALSLPVLTKELLFSIILVYL